MPMYRKHTEEEIQNIREGKARYSATRRKEAALLDVLNEKTATLHTSETKTPFIIDIDDYEAVSYYSWSDDHGYVSTKIGSRPTRRNIRLHIFLLGPAPEGLEWDHRNRDALDNRRSNIRAVTHSINMLNRGLQPNNTSGFAGVSRAGNKWSARIQLCGESIWLGNFGSIEEAVQARKDAEDFYTPGAKS